MLVDIDEPNMRGYTEYPLFATTVAYAKEIKLLIKQ